ncbi:hypothetical protein [Candidatus Enterococcus clewellii]|uniref:DUF4179 domain-containing protein n=1 Tax=Candidatus Enterococcus clewellii TaxID=1834193 RepID=A0A242K084_9ENTE|nr:hypothetical protein [Enterococcus sp. 9E7_DIV0242]OTP10593.1 hypothetical protein A5888_003891 [Enterococcus sp. 9E7_DIV0242]
MDKKMRELMKKEKEIPAEVMEKLVRNQEKILNQEIKQEENIVKRNPWKRRIAVLAIVAAVLLLVLTQTPVGAAIEQVLGISKDSGVATVESSEIPVNLELTSTQNGREIKLTKFVATKQKFAFDYQFKIEDEKLKTLLEKQIAAGSNFQDIRLGLFADGSTEDMFGGVSSMSTFRMEGDTFYGSVVSTFDQEKIPENANLSLHIYQLAWEDRDEYEAKLAEAMENNSDSFSVDTALKYEGDWQFDVTYKPLTQTAQPEIIQATTLYDIKANSDALQTMVTFSIPADVAEGSDWPSYNLEVYKNGVKTETPSYTTGGENRLTTFSLSIDLSALDKTSVYKIQLYTGDNMGNNIDEIGSFELQNH